MAITRWLEDKVRASLDRMGVTLVKVLTEVNMAQVVVILILTIFFVIINITKIVNIKLLEGNFVYGSNSIFRSSSGSKKRVCLVRM